MFWKGRKLYFVLKIFGAMIVLLFCGTIIQQEQHCVQTQLEPVMILQYYDEVGNVVEIPSIDIPNECSDAEQAILRTVNNEMISMYKRYQRIIENYNGSGKKFRVLCYPSMGERYLSILVQEELKTETYSGTDIPRLTSWVYDMDKKHIIGETEALEMAAVTLEEVRIQLNQQIDMNPMDPWNIVDISLQAFFVDESNDVTLFFVAQTGGVGDTNYERLYAWNNGEAIRIEIFDEEAPLFSADETERMENPLWNEWYFKNK